MKFKSMTVYGSGFSLIQVRKGPFVVNGSTGIDVLWHSLPDLITRNHLLRYEVFCWRVGVEEEYENRMSNWKVVVLYLGCIQK